MNQVSHVFTYTHMYDIYINLTYTHIYDIYINLTYTHIYESSLTYILIYMD